MSGIQELYWVTHFAAVAEETFTAAHIPLRSEHPEDTFGIIAQEAAVIRGLCVRVRVYKDMIPQSSSFDFMADVRLFDLNRKKGKGVSLLGVCYRSSTDNGKVTRRICIDVDGHDTRAFAAANRVFGDVDFSETLNTTPLRCAQMMQEMIDLLAPLCAVP